MPRVTRTEEIKSALRAGESIRKTASRFGVSRGVTQRLRAKMVAEGEPFGGGLQTERGVIPAPNYNADQPPPPPKKLVYRGDYHGHTFRAPSTPLNIDGWDVERIRNAISLHDQGFFLESSMLALIVTRFAPVYAALSQSLAPALALPRFIRGGERGLGRMVREEVEEQLAPSSGLQPSPYFPPSLWGSLQLDIATLGFSVMQHVHGEEDPETGVRPIFSRRWPTWAVQGHRYRRTYQAITTEGPLDIVNGDGKFTIIGDTEEPHLDGAIRALGLEVLDGVLVKQARASYIDRYGNPKWVAKMPEDVGTNTPEGDDFFLALQTVQGPDGVGVFPYGSEYTLESLASEQSTVFKDALDNIWQYVAALILGTDGTMSPSTGVYSAPIFAGVRRDIVDRRLKSIVRGVNQGHVLSYVSFNYEASIAADRTGWLNPYLEIPLPDPQADARIKSYAERILLFHEIVAKEREAGFLMTQERANQLAARLEVEPPTLAEATAQGLKIDVAPTDLVKHISPNEIRRSRDLPPRDGERFDKTVGELEQEAAEEQAAAEAEAKAEADAKTAEAEAEAGAEADIKVADETDEGPKTGADLAALSAAFHADLREAKQNGLEITQGLINELAERYGVPPYNLRSN